MSTKSKTKRRSSGSNKDRILKAASAILLKNGAGGLSVRAIAKMASLSTIGIYSHFNGKQGILDALYIEGFNLVRKATDSALEIQEPRAAVLRGVKNYLSVADEHEASYRLIFGEAADFTPGDDARIAGQMAFQSLVNLVARILPHKSTRRQKQRAAVQIWALVHGFVSIRHHGVQDIVQVNDWTPQIVNAVNDMIDSLNSNRASKNR